MSPDIKKALDLVPKSIDKAVENISDPTTKEIGSALGDLFHLAFGKISYQRTKQDLKESHTLDKLKLQYEEDLKDFKRSVEKRVNQIPEDQKQEPTLSVTGNILDKARFCINEATLREMFAKLIAGSLDSHLSDSVHPSFASIISSMSVIDAKNFSLFAYGEALPVAEYYRIDQEHRTREFGITPIFISYFSEDSHVQAMSIISLERLGLVKYSFDKSIPYDGDTLYRSFYETAYYKEICARHGDDINVRRGYIECTAFGRRFGRACLWGPAIIRDKACYFPGQIY